MKVILDCVVYPSELIPVILLSAGSAIFALRTVLTVNLTFTFAEQLYIDKDIKYDIYDLKRIDSNVIYQLDNEGFVLMSK